MLSTDQVPRARLVMASSGIVPIKENISQTAEDIKNVITAYISGKIGPLPSDLSSRVQFESDGGAVATERFSHGDSDIWAVRFNEPDEGTAGRLWTVELTVGKIGNELLLGSRLNCFSRNYQFEFDPAVPRIIRTITNQHGYSDYGLKLTSFAMDIENERDVDYLCKVIQNQNRWRPVIVASCDDDGNTLVDVEGISYKIAGIVHAFKITPQASYLLSEAIGKHHSVFDKGVRIYRSKFSDGDEASRHPLYLRRVLTSASSMDIKRIESDIRRDCFRSSIERDGLALTVPSFAAIKVAAAKARVNSLNAEGSSWQERFMAELAAREAAENQVAEVFSLAAQEEETRKEIEAERDVYRGQIYSLKNRITALELQIKTLGEAIEPSPFPDRYEDVSEWVEQNFAGKLVLHPRAKRGLKGAMFEDIRTVCNTLKLLANEYRDVYLGDIRRDEFDKILTEQKLDLSGSISEDRAKEFDDEYFVKWNDSRRFLCGHIQKGNSRDERYCLRIYFFWCQEDQVIVVGWLPSHLKNKLT